MQSLAAGLATSAVESIDGQMNNVIGVESPQIFTMHVPIWYENAAKFRLCALIESIIKKSWHKWHASAMMVHIHLYHT